jgi:hypothetical protein
MLSAGHLAMVSSWGNGRQRQADLDSLRAQPDQLGDRIDYSTVDVTFVAEQIGGPAPNEYKGFLGQVERGWDALVYVAGNLVLLLACCLPGWACWLSPVVSPTA